MKFKRGDTVRKVSGSQWHGVIVGTYSTTLTPEGYAVESWTEKGSVQIYPAKALEHWTPAPVAWRVDDGNGDYTYFDKRWGVIPSNAEPLYDR
jgi:hypothetical protein